MVNSPVPQQQLHPPAPPSPPSDDTATSRRLSCCSSSSGGRTTSRRGSDFPVENLALQKQVDTLHWQLKQAEASRQMYRAVMQQVVGFLERAHRSLDLLSERQRVVQRSRSEFHVAGAGITLNSSGNGAMESIHHSGVEARNGSTGDAYAAFRDFTWRRPKRQQTAPDEIPPEKLSQEAYRLFRTAQSLLNTREPDLAHVTPDLSPKDQEFLSQLAKEFPRRPERATSFSVNPQLISPSDREIRIATAFNRKLSLQRTPVCDARRDFLRQDKKFIETEFSSGNITSNSNDSDGVLGSKRNSVVSIHSKKEKSFFEAMISADKPPSPKTGSVSSAEDESGFSSMNSFQEVGLPLTNSTLIDNNETSFFKNGDLSVNSSDSNITQIDVMSSEGKGLDKSKLIWNRVDIGLPIAHRRWSSTPVEVAQNDPLKVLWV